MAEDAVGAERHDDGGMFFLEDLPDRSDNVVEGNVGDAAIR